MEYFITTTAAKPSSKTLAPQSEPHVNATFWSSVHQPPLDGAEILPQERPDGAAKGKRPKVREKAKR